MGFNVDPRLLVQAIKSGQNPQQLMLNILQNNMASSPMSANLYQLAKSGNTAEIEKIVRNIAKSQGIDFDKETVTREEVLRQLAACKAGDISEEELTAAREAILSSLRGIHDSPSGIEGYYATTALSGMGLTPAEYLAAVEAVTKEAVIAAANTLQLHTTYFLKGGSQ